MKNLLKRNFIKAITEVFASIAGTLGIVFIIAFIASQQSHDLTTTDAFTKYFRGGQIGLLILALSGIIFIALLKHRAALKAWSIILYIVYVLPIIATAFIIGLNPGFEAHFLTSSNLLLLWVIYSGLHVLWLVILLFESTVPSPGEAANAQEDRVAQIKEGATGRV